MDKTKKLTSQKLEGWSYRAVKIA